MIAQQTLLKTGSWRDCASAARRVYHQAIVPVMCVGMLCLFAANIVSRLTASF